MSRDYSAINARIKRVDDRPQQMQMLVDLLWDELHATGVSWVGFYLHEGRDELLLGPRRDKPACSPIGLHGACGQALRTRRTLIVHDVRALGENYVACDPRDSSEIVVPCIEPDGTCQAVLDLDSHAVGAFDQRDAEGLESLLRTAGLTH